MLYTIRHRPSYIIMDSYNQIYIVIQLRIKEYINWIRRIMWKKENKKMAVFEKKEKTWNNAK